MFRPNDSVNDDDDRLGLSSLPAEMGSLVSGLLHLDLGGNGITRFPVSLTQLTALQVFKAEGNEFVELPAAIVALSRLTELRLGRIASMDDPGQVFGRRPLDVRALGDLSAFPALGELSFSFCEVVMCESVLRAQRHASLASLSFHVAHPAPECALAVLQLSKELKALRRVSVVSCVHAGDFRVNVGLALQLAGGRSPYQKFKAALEACGL